MIGIIHRDDEIPGNQIRKVVRNHRILGGRPTLSGTRISVYEVAAFAEDGMDVPLESWPYLSKEDVETSIDYVRKHPREGELNEVSD